MLLAVVVRPSCYQYNKVRINPFLVTCLGDAKRIAGAKEQVKGLMLFQGYPGYVLAIAVAAENPGFAMMKAKSAPFLPVSFGHRASPR